MKRFVYEYYTNYEYLDGWGIEYWNAVNYREAKKGIFEAYKDEIEQNPNFKITMIAEIKYEVEL